MKKLILVGIALLMAESAKCLLNEQIIIVICFFFCYNLS